MYRLLSFLRKIYVPVIFLALEVVALYCYANSTTISQARLLAVSDNAMRGVYGKIADMENFAALGKTNRLLETRVQMLENELAGYRKLHRTAMRDSTKMTAGSVMGVAGAAAAGIAAEAEFPHRYMVARVVRNSINKLQNYIMIDRGRRDSVVRGMAVLSLDGCMVGYVESVSNRSAICVSALNTQFKVAGMAAGTGHFGSISWTGGDARFVRLTEVPKYAEIERGDTITTSGYSFNFPEGIFIGTVEGISTDEARASYNIDVRLGADISSLRTVILVESPEVEDLIELEKDVLGTEQR